MQRIDLEISNPCNEHCIHCYRHSINSQKGFLSVPQASSVMEQAKKLGASEVTITGGEALLNPQWRDIVCSADQLGLRISLFTNGSLLEESGADFLATVTNLKEVQFSLYAIDEAIHDSITQLPGSCARTKKAISLLHERSVPIFVSCPGMKENKVAVTQVMRWCDANKINSCANIFIFGSSDYKGANLVNRLSNEDLEDFFQLSLENEGELSYIWGNKCSNIDFSKTLFYSGMADSLLVSGDGTIYPMIGFYEKLGNIETDSLEDIYNNHPLLLQARSIYVDDISECKNCSVKEYCDFCCAPHLTAHRGLFRKVDTSFCNFIRLKKDFINRRDAALQQQGKCHWKDSCNG